MPEGIQPPPAMLFPPNALSHQLGSGYTELCVQSVVNVLSDDAPPGARHVCPELVLRCAGAADEAEARGRLPFLEISAVDT
eukprot:CAMPEP_0117515716 /NCGR_PEP_ID=MMETSP0784-20121206/30722_1 /TAXON_ID=39447 /ORGANISM="" /LENGTH=80 /DNA_ID=CAMNT_0005311539 /DNA_START=199 /DNA_END=439 /DNA_ORIENTATION=+